MALLNSGLCPPRAEDAGNRTYEREPPRLGKVGGCAPPGARRERLEGGQMFWTTIPELAAEGHVSPDRLYELARRKKDPLPLRYLGDDARYGQVLLSELDEWVRRNGELYAERSEA